MKKTAKEVAQDVLKRLLFEGGDALMHGVRGNSFEALQALNNENLRRRAMGLSLLPKEEAANAAEKLLEVSLG